MLKHPLEFSTTYYYYLCKFIKSFSKAIVKKCVTYVKHNYVCKVYVCLGKCSKYLRCRQLCNIKVTKLEFKKLLAKKKKLRMRIKES